MLQMNANFTFMIDCWADPVAHLLLLKNSMPRPNVLNKF